MREYDDAALELRLRGVLREHLGALPLDLTVDALDRRREVRRDVRRRRALVALVLAAALLVPLGVLGSGGRTLFEATVVPVPSASPLTASPSPSIPFVITGPTSGPGRTPVIPGTYRLARAWLLPGRMAERRDRDHPGSLVGQVGGPRGRPRARWRRSRPCRLGCQQRRGPAGTPMRRRRR